MVAAPVVRVRRLRAVCRALLAGRRPRPAVRPQLRPPRRRQVAALARRLVRPLGFRHRASQGEQCPALYCNNPGQCN